MIYRVIVILYVSMSTELWLVSKAIHKQHCHQHTKNGKLDKTATLHGYSSSQNSTETNGNNVANHEEMQDFIIIQLNCDYNEQKMESTNEMLTHEYTSHSQLPNST